MNLTKRKLLLGGAVTLASASTLVLVSGVLPASAHGHNLTVLCGKSITDVNDGYQTPPTPKDGEPALVNHITVIGPVTMDQDFTNSVTFTATAYGDYKVIVRAWDDPKGTSGYSYNARGTLGDCPPPVTEPATTPTTPPTTPTLPPTTPTEPDTTPATEPATTPATEPATTPATEPATTPVVDSTPATEPDTTPGTLVTVTVDTHPRIGRPDLPDCLHIASGVQIIPGVTCTGPAPVVPTSAAAPLPTDLPATGVNHGLLALVALGFLLAGALAIAAARRKETPTE